MMIHSFRRLSANLRSADNSAGFTLIEVLVAICIFGIGLLGVAALQIHIIKNNTTGRFSMDAMAWTAEHIEQFISDDWENVNEQSTLNFEDGRNCQIAWAVDPNDKGFKVVTVTTTWQNTGASRKSVTFEFIKPEI